MPLPSETIKTLEAICDAFLPPESTTWRRTVAGRIAAALDATSSVDDRARFVRLVRLLDSAPCMFCATGRWGPFSSLSPADREAALRSLAHHPVRPLRGAFQVLKRLAVLFYYADSDDEGRNPTWSALEYPGPLPHATPPRCPIAPLTITSDTSLRCDVAIVGSGAGGGVVAGELAAAGLDVVVIERGPLADSSVRTLGGDRGLTTAAVALYTRPHMSFARTAPGTRKRMKRFVHVGGRRAVES